MDSHPPPYDVRCLHLDYDQPPLESDIGAELHRRCTARVPYEPDKLSEDRQYLSGFCYLHRVRYADSDTRASKAEVADALHHLDRLTRHMAMPQAAPEPEKPVDPSAEELRLASERKRRLIEDAKEHGLFDPEERE